MFVFLALNADNVFRVVSFTTRIDNAMDSTPKSADHHHDLLHSGLKLTAVYFSEFGITRHSQKRWIQILEISLYEECKSSYLKMSFVGEIVQSPSSSEGVFAPIPRICKRDQEPELSSCQSVCSCDASGFVSCVGKNLDAVPSDLPENLISL